MFSSQVSNRYTPLPVSRTLDTNPRLYVKSMAVTGAFHMSRLRPTPPRCPVSKTLDAVSNGLMGRQRPCLVRARFRRSTPPVAVSVRYPFHSMRSHSSSSRIRLGIPLIPPADTLKSGLMPLNDLSIWYKNPGSRVRPISLST